MSYSNYAASDYAAYARETGRSGLASASRMLGFIGLLAWILPIVGFPIAVIGLVLGIVSLKDGNRGKTLTGIVLCSVGLVLTLVNSAAGIYLYTQGKSATSPTEIINPHFESRPSASTTSP